MSRKVKNFSKDAGFISKRTETIAYFPPPPVFPSASTYLWITWTSRSYLLFEIVCSPLFIKLPGV